MYPEAAKAAVRVNDPAHAKHVGNLLAVIAFEQENLPGGYHVIFLQCSGLCFQLSLHGAAAAHTSIVKVHHNAQHERLWTPL